MKIGAHLKVEDYPDFLRSAEALERNGYARAWVVDSQMLWEDCYVYVALAMEKTRAIQFGTAVSNPVTRHYTVSASASATLGRLYPGRWILGIGRGDSAVRTLGMKPMKTGEMEPVLRKIQTLLQGEPVSENGAEIRIRWVKEDMARGKVPLCYAATGPRNLAMGGALADIVMLQVGTHPAAVKWAVDHVRRGAEEAGRDPDEVEISLLCGMWVSDDVALARDKCRWAATCATNHLEDVVGAGGKHGLPRELLDMVEAKRDKYDYYKGHLDSEAEHTSYLTDEMIDRFAIAGPADHCLKRIQELKNLGVHEISSAYLNGEYEQIDAVGSQIISRLS
jgi:alkanesulfonate monooxygenase SsuD/methylene tetrahydromethanopterin reductase-like flavin-dependent oxidoreductase (luciferase family)